MLFSEIICKLQFGNAFRSQRLNSEKLYTDLKGWPLLVSLVDHRPAITKSNIVSKFPWYEIIIAMITSVIIYHC